MGDRRPAEVPAQTLELGSVTRPYGDASVHIETAALAHALRPARTSQVNDAQQRLARSIARDAVASGGRTTERRERELLAVGLLGVALAGAVDPAAVAREDLLHALVLFGHAKTVWPAPPSPGV